MKSLFFDLDGTILDSSRGIHLAFVQTFERLNLSVPDPKTIRTFMGPPLEVTFKQEVGADKLKTAIQYYREYYKEKGQFQAQVYPGIFDLLKELHTHPDYRLYITTSKHESIALQMCHHFSLTDYFDGIYGSTDTEFHKDQVLRRAISEQNSDKKRSILIGDTKFDIIGGQSVGIKTLAITWGYGAKETLLAAQPDYLTDTPQQVLDILKTF